MITNYIGYITNLVGYYSITLGDFMRQTAKMIQLEKGDDLENSKIMISDDITPIRKQYLEIKRQYPNAILFFRLGDFYETFDQDAEIASRELDIVLTSRNVAKGSAHPDGGHPAPRGGELPGTPDRDAASMWRSASRWASSR